MVLSERNGLRVECINPNYCQGIQHVWISDTRKGSPTKDQILVHVTGKTLAEAVEAATDKLAKIHELAVSVN